MLSQTDSLMNRKRVGDSLYRTEVKLKSELLSNRQAVSIVEVVYFFFDVISEDEYDTPKGEVTNALVNSA